MQAGRLNKRVKLQQPVGNQDDYGESVTSYSNYATVWASIKPLSGDELLHAKQIQAETNHEIRIRHRSYVKPDHRVIYVNPSTLEERIFEITAVRNPREKNQQLILMCKEIS